MRLTKIAVGVALAGALTSCGGGGGGSSGEVTITGQFTASAVEGIEVCVKDTFYCTTSDSEGKFTLKAPTSTPTLLFKVGDVEVGEYTIKESGEVINPFKLTADSRAGEIVAKVIHAVGGDTSGVAPKVSLKGLDVWSEPQVESIVKAVEEKTPFTLEVRKVEDGELYTVNVKPEDGSVELCYGEECQPVEYRKWLFLVYMDGDNSLSEYVDKDIEEMASVTLPPQVKVVVLADYLNAGGLKVESDEKSGGLIKEELPEPDMGSEETLKEFIRSNIEKYPATNVALILWNHGDGWRSKMAAVDVKNNSYLYMYKVVNALEELKGEGYGVNLIGFDECLMGMAEVFYDVGAYAEAVVASETYEPSSGWDYGKILEGLKSNPSMDAYQLGKVIVDAFRELPQVLNDMTLILMSKEEIEQLTENINQLADSLSQETLPYFEEARSSALEVPDTYYVDLYSLVKELPMDSAQNIKTLIENAYKAVSGGYQGISIYFPKSSQDDGAFPCYLKDSPGGALICFNDENYYNPFAVNRWDEFLVNYYALEEE